MLKEHSKIAIKLHGFTQELHIWESNPRKELQPGKKKNYMCEDVHCGVSYSSKTKTKIKITKKCCNKPKEEMMSVMTLSP